MTAVDERQVDAALEGIAWGRLGPATTGLAGLFALFARVVRRGIARGEGLPDATWRDFPIGEADDACLDLVAVCRAPRA